MSDTPPTAEPKPRKKKPKGVVITGTHIAFAVVIVFVGMLWLQQIGLTNQTRMISDELPKINQTQSVIINWINNRQEPFNNDVILWANTTTQTIKSIQENVTGLAEIPKKK